VSCDHILQVVNTNSYKLLVGISPKFATYRISSISLDALLIQTRSVGENNNFF